MIRNYLSVSIRNIIRNRLSSCIHIAGLAIGLSCVLLITLFVKDEFSYDRFHKKYPRIFRITTTVTDKEGNHEFNGNSGQVQGPAFKAAIPEVTDYVRLMSVSFNVQGTEKTITLNGLYADESFFNFFSFPLKSGHPASALSGTTSMVLSESSAMKFFGRTDVVGKVLTVQDGGYSQPFIIKAIVSDPPGNSSIQFQVLLPFKYLEKSFKDDNWLSSYLTTFVMLQNGAEPAKVSSKFPGVFAANAGDQLKKFRQTEGYSSNRKFGLQPLADIHLNRTGLERKKAGGDAGAISRQSTLTYSYILMGIVGFILLMACINFVNLNIANSLRRAKEVGVRKITGSTRLQIIWQFLCEAFILCFLSFTVGLLLTKMVLPLFNSLVEKRLELSNLIDAGLIMTWSLLLLGCVIAAGLYPAIVFSKFNPKEVLYNKFRLSTGHWLGKTLVVFQFALAICLIVTTIVYHSQMSFISRKDLGYDPNNVVRVWIPVENPKQAVPKLRTEFAVHPAIKSVSTAGDNSDPVLGGFPTQINGRQVRYVITDIDTSFLPMMKIPLIEGRNFSAAFGGDRKRSAIVNEAFLRAAGLTSGIGQTFENTWGGTDRLTIVGVVRDYHYGSLRNTIYPQVMILHEELPFFWLKIREGKRAEVVSLLENIFTSYAPTYPAQFNFLEEDIEIFYSAEKRWQQIISFAAVISILICCIGLFGLAHLATAQRTKEIGVRKVLGASVYNIVALLSKDVGKLVIISALIAFPAAWYVMKNWLQGFAYRIDISWWYFLLGGAIAIIIALLTVGAQAVRTAVINPVKSLRTE